MLAVVACAGGVAGAQPYLGPRAGDGERNVSVRPIELTVIAASSALMTVTAIVI